MKSRVYVAFLFYQMHAECILYQTFCHGTNGYMQISHPNLLPVLEVSKTLFPFCIMSPWMPDGNIIQYTKMNPDVNRLMLVCAYQHEDQLE